MKQNLKLILSVLAGNFLLAFCVCAFVIPNNIMLGGANGISLFVQMFLPEVRLSVISACVNISLFILGWLFLGWKFAATSLTSTIIAAPRCTTNSKAYSNKEILPPSSTLTPTILLGYASKKRNWLLSVA